MEAFLSRIPLFSVLPKESLLRLVGQARENRSPKGSVIFKEGEAADWIWVVKEGWIRLVRYGASGRPITIFIMTPEEVLCGLSAFDHAPYSATGIAATDSVLIQIPASTFSALMDENPPLMRQIISNCCHRIKKMGDAYSIAYEPVRNRITGVLVRLHDKFGNELPFTHREIAEMAGTTTESCIRTLSQMKRKGLLQRRRGLVTLRNFRLLSRALNQ